MGSINYGGVSAESEFYGTFVRRSAVGNTIEKNSDFRLTRDLLSYWYSNKLTSRSGWTGSVNECVSGK